jgi:hypothetical protein
MSPLLGVIALQNMLNVNRLLSEQTPRQPSPPPHRVINMGYGVKDIGTWKLRKDGVYERVLVAPGLQYCTVKNDPIYRKITIMSKDMGFNRLVEFVSFPDKVIDTSEYSIIAYTKSKQNQLIIELYKV